MIGIFDKQAGIDLLDSKSADKLNSLQRWHWAATFPIALGDVKIVREEGPLFSRLTVSRPGSVWPLTVITLPTNGKRIEFSNTLDKSKMPYVASLQTAEYYSFTFPLKFDSSSDVWVDDGIGFHRIPDDYLPGARTDAAVPQHSLVLTGNSAGRPLSVVLSERQSFFNYLPGMPGVKDKSKFFNVIKAVAIRKQDQGDTRDLGMVNFAELEPGMEHIPMHFDFALTSRATQPDFVNAYHAGMEFASPMLTTDLAPHTTPATPSAAFFTIDAPNVVLLAFKPSADCDPNHYTVRLQEIAGKPASANIGSVLRVSKAEETDMTEREVLRAVPVPIQLALKPHQTITLRLTIPHETKSRSHRWWEW